ncbi:isochorismatase family protein [Bifidobacterium mongoliense]|uniref:isochorismatase family protein n=1 Tax=Bifidobacterium mongoliense TaxID=518643 RepID=UPI002647F2B2|nr:isochorismatase family protein [Bifidobacterium mongoliense]MDN5632982.1 isochorismatase family protein [Bifidobacterium mongoliense]
MTRALLIIDVQNDFTEGGALGVTGGHAVAEGITRFLADHAGDYAAVIASRDWHDADSDNGGHFAHGAPDFVHTWPVHCVAGTHGAQYDPRFHTRAVTNQIFKGQGVPAYSLFEGTAEDGATVEQLLHRAGVDAVDVAGIATDYCVRASVLDALKLGFSVRVLRDLVAGVAPDSSRAALKEMAAAGAELVA